MDLVVYPKQDLENLITQLKIGFSGSGIHYWIIPVIDSGVI